MFLIGLLIITPTMVMASNKSYTEEERQAIAEKIVSLEKEVDNLKKTNDIKDDKINELETKVNLLQQKIKLTNDKNNIKNEQIKLYKRKISLLQERIDIIKQQSLKDKLTYGGWGFLGGIIVSLIAIN